MSKRKTIIIFRTNSVLYNATKATFLQHTTLQKEYVVSYFLLKGKHLVELDVKMCGNFVID